MKKYAFLTLFVLCALFPSHSFAGDLDDLPGLAYYTVHFKGPIFEHQKGEVVALEGELLDYSSEHTFIVRATRASARKISALSFIESVRDYPQKTRISKMFQATTIFNAEKRERLLVEFFAGVNIDRVLTILRRKNVNILEASGSLLRVEGDRSDLFFLEQLQDVSWLGPDLDFTPQPPLPPAPSHMGLLNAGFAADFYTFTGHESGTKIIRSGVLNALGFTGEGQILAYSDTGLDIGEFSDKLHADFQGQIKAAYAAKGDNWADRSGHGTHVAGLLVGKGAASEGKIRASAYDAQLVVQSLAIGNRFWVPTRIGPTLFIPAYEQGARIHSNSWGGNHRWATYTPYSKSVDKFIWEHPDYLVLFPSGNKAADMNLDGVIDPDSIDIPGSAKNCLTVGASENYILTGALQMNWQPIGARNSKWEAEPILSDLVSDDAQGLAAFSGRGPARDYRIKPDIVAPGTNILSTKSHMSESGQLWAPFDENYQWSGGTSMAAPIAASAAALIREYLIKERKLSSPSSALLKALIINGAVDLFPGQYGDTEQREITSLRPNFQEGWGRLNVERSTLETESRHILLFDESTGLATGESKEYHFTVTDASEPIAMTLVYHDHPSASSRGKFLVNDLDLQAIDNRKTLLFPNGLERRDDTNNVEGIDILSPKVGPLSVTVSAFTIPQGQAGKQPYALVVSGGIVEAR